MSGIASEDPSLRRWRLLKSLPSRGASQMALDQTLLEAASGQGFRPTMRFYRWSPPAVSVGRFQPLNDLDLGACSAEGIEVVRRPTGGKSILHLDDFTYSLILPRGFPLPDSVVEAYRLVCAGILRALGHLGLDAVIQPRDGTDYRQTGGACFAASTQADLEFDGRKLCGSAQVRRGGALLQHGSILLEDHSETLHKMLFFPDEGERESRLHEYRERCISLDRTGRRYEWSEVAESFLCGFAEAFAVEIEEGPLSVWETDRWGVLSAAYASEQWLCNAASRAFPC